MAWQGVADNVTIASGSRVRVNIDVGAASIGVGDESFRAYIPQYASLSIVSVDRDLFGTKWHIVATLTEDAVVNELRADVTNGIAAMRSEWLIAAPGMYVDTIEIEKTSIIPDIPVSTTISLVAFAVLGLVAVWFVAKYS